MKQHRVIHVLFGMLTALAVAVFVLTITAGRTFTDRSVYREAAQRSVPDRMAAFESSVRELAGRVHFAPETALAFYDETRVRQLTDERVDWLLSIPGGQAPDFSADGLTEAILQDELFDGGRQIARDEGAYEVERLARRSFLPLRSSLVRLAGDYLGDHAGVLRRVRSLTGFLPWLLLILILVFTAVHLLPHIRRFSLGCAWLFASFAAGALGAAVLAVPVATMRIPETVGEVSGILAGEAGHIISAFMTRHLLICAALFLVSCLLFLLCRHRAAKESL